MNAQTAKRSLEDLERALGRLAEALAIPAEAPLAIDGTIQRFEFVFELCWKAMKAVLELQSPGAELGTPRATIKAAYAAGGIDSEAGWLDLIEVRNATSHTYRETLARDIYRRIEAHLPMLRATARQLKLRLES